MFRGIKTFKCDNCGHRFDGPDFEYMATIFSEPIECPICGSMHTYPAGFTEFFGLGGPGFYRDIWKDMDKENRKRR